MNPDDLLDLVVDKASGRCDYFDARYQKGESLSIVKRMTEEEISSGVSEGISIRVLKGEQWRSSGLSQLNKDAVLREVERLVSFKSSTKTSYKPYEGWTLREEYPMKIPFSDISIEEKLNKVRELFNSTKQFDPKIVAARAAISHSLIETAFVNSEGSYLKQKIPIIRLVIVAIAREGEKVQQDYFSHGVQGGYEVVSSVDEERAVKEVAEGAVQLLDAKPTPSGRFPVVLDPQMAGLIAHESFGHGLEADQVLRDRSFLSGYLEKRVASDPVTISDDSAAEGLYGSYYFDDEGIKSRKNILVENGILKSFIHTRETASMMNASVTANGRAQDFSRRIYVRMSNTYFEKGDHSFEELIEDIKHGIYLAKASHGMEDPLGGGIQVGSMKAYLIEKGETTQLLRAAALSGNVLDLLMKVSAIGKDFRLDPGTCGKGYEDFIGVTSGGPSIRVDEGIVSGG
ncbi:MAG: TldD/PmbA family protein [Candidatus Hodarchaeota archaeon]